MVTQIFFLSHLGQVISKNLCFLYQDEEVQQIFTFAHIVSSLSVRTLRSHLVRAKVYSVEERLVGPRKCSKSRSQVCKNVIETDTFLLIRRFIKSIVGLHVVINVWFTSCCVTYVVYNITVKLMTNSDTGGIFIRITTGKA